MSTPSALARLRRTSLLLRSVEIRQAARRAFDLTGFGTGALERIASALILGAAYVLATLLIGILTKLSPAYALGAAAVGFASAMTASAALVLWKSDAELAAELPRLQREKKDLRYAAAEEWVAQVKAREAERALRKAGAVAGATAPAVPETKRCPFCQERVKYYALKCRHCGEILDEGLRQERRPRHWNPGVAAVLSFFIPGLGQMYKGAVLLGFGWLFLTYLGYLLCLIPGFILHIVCVFEAASGGES